MKLSTYLGLAFMITNTIVMYILFLGAYFFGNYRILVTINQYGEANIELLMFIVMFPLVLNFIIQLKRKNIYS